MAANVNPSQQRDVNILVVDDVEANLVAFEALLEGPSVNVVRARSGRQAVSALRADEYALVVLDVQMPDMDGFETAAAIRRDDRTRRLPIIFITAHGTTQEKLAKAYALGASDFLEKPIEPSILRSKVGAITDLWRMIRDAKRDADERLHRQLAEERQRWETEALRARVAEQERATAAERNARVEAEKANTIKDEFLAILSHELRTPLNAILGWAVLMKARAPTEPSFTRGIEIIERNARAQARLVEDMLDTSRIVAGKLRLEMLPVDVPRAIDRVIDAMRPAAARKRLDVSVDVDRNLQPIAADADRLEQILSNVVSNAIKFTQEEGKVSVNAAREASHLRIAVTDTGDGISAEFLPHVFDRFRQGERGPARSRGGLGIGLSLARNLIELHGGTIEAHSDGPGRGSTFVIRLPIRAVAAQPRAAATPVEAAAAPSLAGIRVLVVDDEADARDLLREVLQGAGATVLTVGSGGEALASLSSWHPAVVISDIGMRGMDGYTLMREIRARPAGAGGDVRAIALTAYASVDDVVEARSAGFQTHLAKPVEAAQLVSTVAAVAASSPG